MNSPYRKLAVGLVSNAVDSVRSRRPERWTGERDADYNNRVKNWREQRDNDCAWFFDPKRSAMWIEAAGASWESVVERMKARGWLSRAEAA